MRAEGGALLTERTEQEDTLPTCLRPSPRLDPLSVDFVVSPSPRSLRSLAAFLCLAFLLLLFFRLSDPSSGLPFSRAAGFCDPSAGFLDAAGAETWQENRRGEKGHPRMTLNVEDKEDRGKKGPRGTFVRLSSYGFLVSLCRIDSITCGLGSWFFSLLRSFAWSGVRLSLFYIALRVQGNRNVSLSWSHGRASAGGCSL